MKEEKTLILPINKVWFNMIKAGLKKEEYREIKPYYVSRLYHVENKTIIKNWFKNKETAKGVTDESISYYLELAKATLKDFKRVEFRNGYGKKVPTLTIELLGVEIKTGREEWGAVKGVSYFTLKLGGYLHYSTPKGLGFLTENKDGQAKS